MTAILDVRTPSEIIRALLRLGHDPLLLPPADGLPTPIASHPDMLLFFAEDAIFCTESYFAKNRDLLLKIARLAHRPIRAVTAEYGMEYPEDVLFNALPLGKHLFCHPQATAREIRLNGAYTVLPVRQGYAKCATLPVGENALISADPSILSVARAKGFDTLAISHGSIVLDGYDYGFIGGCASFAPYGGTDTVYLCGSADTHPEGEKMVTFCRTHDVTLHSLCKRPLTDVGTVFLL